jgi:hypothetical protein
MVGYLNYPLRELEPNLAIWSLNELASHRSVTTDSDFSRTPPFLYGNQKQAKVLLGQSLPSIVPIFVIQIERKA